MARDFCTAFSTTAQLSSFLMAQLSQGAEGDATRAGKIPPSLTFSGSVPRSVSPAASPIQISVEEGVLRVFFRTLVLGARSANKWKEAFIVCFNTSSCSRPRHARATVLRSQASVLLAPEVILKRMFWGLSFFCDMELQDGSVTPQHDCTNPPALEPNEFDSFTYMCMPRQLIAGVYAPVLHTDGFNRSVEA